MVEPIGLGFGDIRIKGFEKWGIWRLVFTVLRIVGVIGKWRYVIGCCVILGLDGRKLFLDNRRGRTITFYKINLAC